MTGGSPFLAASGLSNNPFDPSELNKRCEDMVTSYRYRRQPDPGLGARSLLIRIDGQGGTGKATLANEVTRRTLGEPHHGRPH
jgi:hypothetical protein